jgi:glycosyltransferase involved in cell wall biosynthesis
MNFSEFDVVVVSATGAYASNMIHKGTALQICYCHTPPRYLYGYATARNWKKNPVIRCLGERANMALRTVDKRASSNVDYFVANSREVASRIKKFYQRTAAVIYPPVDAPPADMPQEKKEYFITGGRLAAAKHIELAIQACSTLSIPLKVFGKSFAGYGRELRKVAGPTVDFVGEVSDREKWNLLAAARCFLFPSEDEDFGILPVESMASGTPVIAFRSGGVKETIIEGQTGLFFNELSTQSLIQTIRQFQHMPYHWNSACKRQAQIFSKKRFLTEIRSYIDGVLIQKEKKGVV